jgi:uncharacterized membrane protein
MEEYQKYIILGILILVLDGLWIYANFNMFTSAVKAVQKSAMVVRPYAVFVAYAFVLFASMYIAVPFAKHYMKKGDSTSERLLKALMYGGAVGFAVNGVYNFTSLAIYKDYDLQLAIVDTIWSTVLNTIVVFTYTLL